MNTSAPPWLGLSARWRTAALLIGVFVFATLFAWARLPVATRNVVWAEDGRIFLTERASLGVLPSIFHPYAGYLHFWPRVLAGVASSWPDLTKYAVLMSFGSCMLVGGVAALVFFCSRAVTEWMPARFFFAAITVLVPLAPIEILGNAANVHSYLLWGALWLALYTPKSWTIATVLAVIGLTFALTEIQIVLLVPLVAYRPRSAKMWVVRAGLGLGVAMQFVSTLLSPRADSATQPPLASFLQGYFIQVGVGSYTSNASALASLVASTGWWIGALLFIPFALAFAYAMWRGSAVMRVAAGALMYVSIAVWVFAFRQVGPVYWYSTFSHDQLLGIGSIRYAIVPSMCVLALPPLAAAAFFRRRAMAVRSATARASTARERLGVIAAVVVPFAFACVLLLALIPATTERVGQPDWPSAVQAARASCAADPTQPPLALETAPGGLQPPWDAVVSCSFVAQH